MQVRVWVVRLSLFVFSLAVMAGPGVWPAYAETNPAATVDPIPTETTEPASLPVAEDPVPLSRSARNDQLLASALADEAEWLDTPQGKILALFRPTGNRMTKGAVLLLHAAELPPGWPAPLENLRRNLPEYGWVTLALSLPPQYAATTPERDSVHPATQLAPLDPPEPAAPGQPAAVPEEPEEQKSAANIAPDIPVARAELIARRIAAALEFLRKNNQPAVILVVDNSSVYESLQHLLPTQDGGESPVQAVVLVNLQPQEALHKAQLAGIFSSPGLPVMDVFLHPDGDQQILIRKRHRAEALRNNIEIYHQFVLPPVHSPSIDNARSFWLERVRGFIEKHAQATNRISGYKDKSAKRFAFRSDIGRTSCTHLILFSEHRVIIRPIFAPATEMESSIKTRSQEEHMRV